MISRSDTVLFDNMFAGVYVVDTKRTIIYWNKSATEISGYSKEYMLGKHCYDNILRHVDHSGNLLCFSGCPLVQSFTTGDTTNTNVFLHHKLGHRVPVTVRSIPTYDEAGQVDGAIELFEDSRQDSVIQKENIKLQEMVVTDELTKAYNRRFIDFYCNNLINEASQFQSHFGILFMDIDHFKDVNDRYGHDIGDDVLKMLSATVMNNIRTSDRFGRFGGEEFILIVKLDKEDYLQTLAEKIRMLVEHSSIIIDNGEKLSITISIGGLMYRKGDTYQSLIKKADQNMYEAKETGRNKVIIKGE